jgi:glycolate oxidase iron-sulfur subunit
MPFRAYAQARRSRPFSARITRRLVLETLPHPGRFRMAALSGSIARPFQGLLPSQLTAMINLLPESLPAGKPLPEFFPAQGVRRGRVALLAGCVQQILAPEINWATLRVLARNGVEVVIPQGQGCCGALALHTGESDLARQQALHNMQLFDIEVDAILTNAAGCGSGMKEYPILFMGTPWEKQAQDFAARVQDISVFLDELGLEAPPPLPEPLQIAYHDACHLAHAQGVTAAPRRLLSAIPNLTLVNFPEADLCCGSAGTYNLEHPSTAHVLGERKARNILSSEATVVVAGNIGCLVQLRSHLAAHGQPLPVWHTLEVIDRAYRGWV